MAMAMTKDRLKWSWIGNELIKRVRELEGKTSQQDCYALADIFYLTDDLARLEKEFEIEFAKLNSGRIPDQVWLGLYEQIQIERGE